MTRLNYTILLALIAAAGVVADLLVARLSGQAWGPSGTITRDRHPDEFRRHVRNDYVALALCAAMILWALFSPFAFK
jgi:hypothetical protein